MSPSNDKRRRGRTGPGGRPGSSRSSRTPGRGVAARPAAAGAGSPGRPAPRRPATGVRPRQRLTGRAAVLVLVLAVLVVSYASSMRAYLQQRTQINHLKSSIAEHEANIDALETEKERWDDPAYVQQQARLRLGYVMPGEKTYLVFGEDGLPLDSQGELQDPGQVLTPEPTAWYDTAWDSVELAGHPPKVGKPPASDIDGTKKSAGGEGAAQ
jgi:cell division protein FtsB